MNIVCIGAHPDDPEFYAGASLILWAARGHNVLSVSLTDGRIGHHADPPDVLAARRADEVREAARRGGYNSIILGYPDGELEPTLEARRRVVRVIREAQADIVLGHRAVDYHPDHRYAGMLVQDAAFMVTVPHFCPETSALRRNPVFLTMMDRFTSLSAVRADLAVDADAAMDRKWALLDAMQSQFYEWLPWLDGRLDDVPPASDPQGRLTFLKEYYSPWLNGVAGRHREALRRWYGARGDDVAFAEVFEVSEYGRQPDEAELRALCP